jgi:hypothetical protein
MKLPGPWSHSSLSNYITCPAQYNAMRVEKRFPREENEASIWGTEVHEAIERFLTEGAPLPERMKQFKSYVESLAGNENVEIYVELKLGVLEDGSPCDFDDPECWSRCVVDYIRKKKVKALALDHKTGKRREGSTQLKQNAAIIFAHFPDLEELVTGYAWLQENGKIGGKTIYKRSQIEEIWKSFSKDLNELAWSYETGNWPTRPSGLCGKWCPVITCAYNGRRGKR